MEYQWQPQVKLNEPLVEDNYVRWKKKTGKPSPSRRLVQVSFSNYTGDGICFGTDPVNNVISNVFGNILDTNWGDCYEGTLAGDVNYDGTLDILDLVALANLILGQEYLSSGDMNQDGQLDILDIVSLVNVILSP